jgi:hypothetical protein
MSNLPPRGGFCYQEKRAVFGEVSGDRFIVESCHCSAIYPADTWHVVQTVSLQVYGPADFSISRFKFSHALLELVGLRLKERSYVDLLKRHYRQFKDAMRKNRV